MFRGRPSFQDLCLGISRLGERAAACLGSGDPNLNNAGLLNSQKATILGARAVRFTFTEILNDLGFASAKKSGDRRCLHASLGIRRKHAPSRPRRRTMREERAGRWQGCT